MASVKLFHEMAEIVVDEMGVIWIVYTDTDIIMDFEITSMEGYTETEECILSSDEEYEMFLE